MNPLRLLKQRFAAKVRAVARAEAREAVAEALPLMQRIADFAASPPVARQSAHDLTKDPRGNAGAFLELRGALEAAGVPVEDFAVDGADFAGWLEEFGAIAEHNRSLGDVRVEKSLEHYLSHRLLEPRAGQVYVDVAASHSPYAGLLRGRGVEAYRLDLAFPPGLSGYDLGADATNTGLPGGFADHLALHCSLECFAGDADVRFLAEAARIMKPGGRCVVVPLYLAREHFVASSPYCADGATPETADPEGLFVWRDDPYHVPFSRTYSPASFAARIHAALPDGLTGRVRYAANLPEMMDAEPGQRLYCFFQYVLEKAV